MSVKKKIRNTKSRNELLDKLEKASRPLKYEDFGVLNMDRATFYRNLAFFEKNSLVYSFENGRKKRYFESASKPPHLHFICDRCEKIECLNSLPDVPSGYQISSATVRGVCADCAR